MGQGKSERGNLSLVDNNWDMNKNLIWMTEQRFLSSLVFASDFRLSGNLCRDSSSESCF